MQDFNFGIEVITSGSFVDTESDFKGGAVTISTWVIRLNPETLEAWNASRPIDLDDWEWFGNSWAEVEKVEADHRATRDKIAGKVMEELGLKPKDTGFTLTQNVSEIFTVVYMQKSQKN